jgi:uncharacterized radical SAM superfamily Fe-S cluster-containing enzyme
VITRPSTLSPEEMDRLMERIANSGARITMQDPRVTSLQTWILVTIGTMAIAVGAWGIKSINDLNQNMAMMLIRYDYDTKRVERIEQHVEYVDGRVVVLERKVK